MNDVLELSAIRKRFGATVALDGVDLDVGAGEVLALVGENGAGKSTLLNILSGVLRPDAGRMKINGADYLPREPFDAKRNGIAYIRQELSLFPHLTVAENIIMGGEPARLGFIERDALVFRARKLLTYFGRSEVDARRRVADLSPATRQVVEICRALAWDARVILMDEPTSSLEASDVRRLFATIRTLCAKGIAVIYVSHFLEEVREIADRFTVLRDGRSFETGALASVTDDALVRSMVGRPVESLFTRRKARDAGEVVLEVRALRAPPAVAFAELELRRGEVLGVAGLVGSGRTELVRALFGLQAVSAGAVNVKGKAVALLSLSPSTQIASGVGYLCEDRNAEGLFQQLSLRDNVTLTRPGSRFGWIRARAEERRTAEWMMKLKIKASGAATPVRKLSGGNQQKVLLARLLHQDAEVLLLDEPTRGVDIGSKMEIYELIHQLASAGKAILMVSSNLPELFGICDRLAVMARGTLSRALPIDEWTPESVLQLAIAAESEGPQNRP